MLLGQAALPELLARQYAPSVTPVSLSELMNEYVTPPRLNQLSSLLRTGGLGWFKIAKGSGVK
jgi:hypothetical protein